MARRPVHDDDIHRDRWLVSYADFVTLLMAFFVVMYSISQINESKYRVLSNTLEQVFHIKQEAREEVPIGDPARSHPDSLIELDEDAEVGKEGLQSGDQGAGDESSALANIAKDLQHKFQELIKEDLVTISGNEEWLAIELNSSLLFRSGEALLGYDAEVIINQIAQSLYDHHKAVRVEGFTDNTPISTPKFPSNWELSAARSAAVVQLLVENGLDPALLSAVGYGEYQPKADNSTPEGRNANRRVVLMVSNTQQLRPDVEGEGNQLAAPTDELPLVEDKALEEGYKMIRLDNGGLLFTSGDRPAQQ